MATLVAYARWVRAPSTRRWAAVLACFALGLLSKSMLVTLPVVLLLLDHWPLARHRGTARSELVREKVPLLLMSLAVGLVTIVAQSRAAAVASLDRVGVAQRVANALESATSYLAVLFAPIDLSHYYPHRYPLASQLDTPGEWIPALASLGALAVVGFCAFLARKRFPAIPFGCLWYAITLAPVIGLIQVGNQGMADRYTHLPSIGVWIAIAFPIWQLARTSRARLAYGIAASVVVLGCFAPRTFWTVRRWATNEEICRRSLAAIDARGLPHDGEMHRMLAVSLLVAFQRDPYAARDAARVGDALGAAQTALELRPRDPAAHSTYTDLLIAVGRYRDAIRAADRFVASATAAGRPDFVALAHYASGVAASRMHRYAEARAAFERALAIAPEFGMAAEALAWAKEAGAAP
jgi:tetratricopeptide (TPR) repeat protein